MNTEIIKKYFKEHPWAIKLGAKKTAKVTKTSILEVLSVRNQILESLGKKVRDSMLNIKPVTYPKILIFDIETSPLKAYVWNLWKLNVHLDQILNEWFIICWSAKWLYSNEIFGDVVTPEEAIKENDKRVCQSLWNLINEADIVVAHNGNRFDIPKMNARFIINGLEPTKSYHSIDTCLIARKLFGFSSNKLDALATYFGFKHKLDTDFSLWKKCLEGDLLSLNYMLKYNKLDVKLLEEVYLKLRPWIKNHPNCGNYIESNTPICSNCGLQDISPLPDQYYYTLIGKYQLYKCPCGCISRGRINLRKKKVNNISIAR